MSEVAVVGGKPPMPQVAEFSGFIKWFDHRKGFGFVARKDGKENVLLHITCFASSGYYDPDFVFDGSEVLIEAVKGPQGWNCSRILSLTKGSGIRRRVVSNVGPEHDIRELVGPERLQVRWFNKSKGYGFFLQQDPSKEDIFFHVETLRRSGTKLNPFPREEADVVYGKDFKDRLLGLKAVSVTFLE
jgi:CspA family cold shock protein